MKYFLMLLLTGCCSSMPKLPEHKVTVFTDLKDGCVKETFSITNDFIGFEGDVDETDVSNCERLSGFNFQEWIDLEVYLKAVFDTHNIPDDKINMNNTAIQQYNSERR